MKNWEIVSKNSKIFKQLSHFRQTHSSHRVILALQDFTLVWGRTWAYLSVISLPGDCNTVFFMKLYQLSLVTTISLAMIDNYNFLKKIEKTH